MFLCVSLNPAVDRRLRLAQLRCGTINRASAVRPAAGGKAAHVAMVLQTLGANPCWLGFAGGTTGTFLVEGLGELGLEVKTVPTAGATRMNLEIIEEDGRVTEILEPGPCISTTELARMEQTFERVLVEHAEDTIAILSGSLPVGVPQDSYATLIRLAHRYGSRVFVDTSGEALRAALAAHPEFVKPNQQEAEWLSGRNIHGLASAGSVLKEILQTGASAAAISLGAGGLVWGSAAEKETLVARVPEQPARFSVGSGDATLAGFAFAAEQRLPPTESLRLAAACGAANCLADGPGRARAADILRLKEETRIERLE